jgi:hypothetical protein
MDTVIILTTTVYVQNKCYLHQTDPFDRINVYLKSIKQWIETPFRVIVVENSGYSFTELDKTSNLEIISYNEYDLPEAEYLRGNNSKGASELFAINYAIKNSKILTKNDYIIKVTGRYFIPGFYEYLNSLNLKDSMGNFKFDCISQNDRVSCEVSGCSYPQSSCIFNQDTTLNGSDCNHIEFLYTNRVSKQNKILILKSLEIEPTQMGGVNVIRYKL